jgi:tRNA uridine 5-carboxymethylaminomethyl modification enzyme
MGCKVFDLISRPMVNLKNISTVFPELKAIIDTGDERDDEVCEAAEVKMKYSGYISRERMFADKMHRLENIRIKGHFAYEEIKDLSTEARQKLSRINPDTLAQASRIPGVSPSDINVLLVLMNR